MTGKAQIISATLDQKVALKAAQPAPRDVTHTETKIAKADETIAPPSAHRVQRGETLFSISKRYGVPIEEIKVFNAMKANTVQVGQNLLLTAIDPATMATSNPVKVLRVSTNAKPVQRKPSTYTVRSGDTLYAIALKHAVELDDLLRWNKLSAKSVLQPGNKIRVTL